MNFFILNKNLIVVDVLRSKGDISKISPFFNDKYIQYLETGAETLEFSCYQNVNLEIGNYICFLYKNQYKLFQIIDIDDDHSEVFDVTVYCEVAGLELITSSLRPLTIPSANFKQYLTNVLSDTSWSVGYIDVDIVDVFSIENKDSGNVYSDIQSKIKLYDCEISFRVEIENNRVVGKFIDAYKKRGKETRVRFEYSRELSKVTRKTSGRRLATSLIGYGKDDINFKSVEWKKSNGNPVDKPLNQDFIKDEFASSLYNKNGEEYIDVYRADTSSPNELLLLTYRELQNRKEPQIEYGCKVELLNIDEVELGDTIYVIDNEFDPPLHLAARVNTLELSFIDETRNDVSFANYRKVNSNITENMRNMVYELNDAKENSKKESIVNTIKNHQTNGKDTFAQTSTVEQQFDNLKISFSETGGSNLLLNSVWLDDNFSNWRFEYPNNLVTNSASDKWVYNHYLTGVKDLATRYTMQIRNLPGVKSPFAHSEKILVTEGQKLTLSCWAWCGNGGRGRIEVSYCNNNDSIFTNQDYVSREVIFDTTSSNATRFIKTITIPTGATSIYVRIISMLDDGDYTFAINSLMVNSGSSAYTWSSSNSELVTGIVDINKDGINVSQSKINTTTSMTAEGYYINHKTKGDLFKVDKDGLAVKGKIESDEVIMANGGIYTNQAVRGRNSGGTVFVGSYNDTVLRADAGEAYIQGLNEVKCTKPADPNTYIDLRAKDVKANNKVYANGVALTSNRDYKKNITDYTEDALNEICTTPIREYHLVTDLDNELKRVGVIVQEAPVNAVDLEGNGVDLYQMIAMAWKSIQQLKEEISMLKRDV